MPKVERACGLPALNRAMFEGCFELVQGTHRYYKERSLFAMLMSFHPVPMKALILVFAVLGLVGCSQSTLMVTETGSVLKRFGREVVAEANEEIEISRILSNIGKASKS